MEDQQSTETTQKKTQNTQTEQTQQTTTQDVDNAKALGIVGYIIPILFFLPMVTEAKSNSFAMYHANQQLLLLLYWVVGNIVGQLLVFVLIGFIVLPLVWIFGIILMIMGIVNVVNGEKKPLPLIGSFELIK